MRRRLKALVILATFPLAIPAAAASTLSLGPRAVQSLVAEQLFSRAGRWYLIDDGGVCFTYLESPHIRLEGERLVLMAHLSSRLGQRLGSSCAGADFTSNVTLSAKMRGAEHKLVLDDIRIDRVDDEATRTALNFALQFDPQALPRTASIDVFELLRQQLIATQRTPMRLDQFRIVNVAARADALVIQFDLSLIAP